MTELQVTKRSVIISPHFRAGVDGTIQSGAVHAPTAFTAPNLSCTTITRRRQGRPKAAAETIASCSWVEFTPLRW
ncbi:MAG TPA: hypothetical protein VMV56_02555 [Williamwhitmania sp.]|nr:hypothetical protein [Williamwhitmania sp.]